MLYCSCALRLPLLLDYLPPPPDDAFATLDYAGYATALMRSMPRYHDAPMTPIAARCHAADA